MKLIIPIPLILQEGYYSREKAYVFGSTEVWDGLESTKGKVICEGLIRDIANWQREKGEDVRDIPTIRQHGLKKTTSLGLSPSHPLPQNVKLYPYWRTTLKELDTAYGGI